MGDENDEIGILHDEAREVVSNQLSRTETIENRAGRILRVTILAIGAGLTAISISIQLFQQSPQQLIDILKGGPKTYITVSLLSLGCASIFAAIAYTATPIRFGPSGRDVRRLFENLDNGSTRTELVAGYSLWADMNREPLEKSRFWITGSIACLVLATLSIGVGALTTAFPVYFPTFFHLGIILILSIWIAILMGVVHTYQSYKYASLQATQAREDFREMLDKEKFDHVLEGASFGSEKTDEQSKLRQMALAGKMEEWLTANLGTVIPDFDEIIIDEPRGGGNVEDFLVSQTNGTRVAILSKTHVNEKTAEEIIKRPSSSANPEIDLYVVALDYTKPALKKLQEREDIHVVKIDEDWVKRKT